MCIPQLDDAFRAAFPLDNSFPTLNLRPEAAGGNQWYRPDNIGLEAEVYNPAYFRKSSGSAAACQYVPSVVRSCFQPIYGLECLDNLELTYHEPVAFWTSAFADRVAEVPGAVGARSVVFGFEPAFINPSEFKTVMEKILFNEWKLPKQTNLTAAGSP